MATLLISTIPNDLKISYFKKSRLFVCFKAQFCREKGLKYYPVVVQSRLPNDGSGLNSFLLFCFELRRRGILTFSSKKNIYF